MKRHNLLRMVLFTLFIAIIHVRPVQAADVVVGDGTLASCTEATFDAAWTQLYNELGGTLTFNCGAAPHSIGFYTAKNVDDIQITIDGGNAITLQALTIQPGGSGTRLFQIFEGGFLTLQNIVLTGGRSPAGDGWGAQGGSIVLWDDAEDADAYEVASLTMRNSTISNSASTAWGGAIANEGGIVLLENSGIYASSAPYGGAFNGTGYETFANVTVSGNHATQAGGGLRFWHSPRVQISTSNIADNFATTLDGGGIDNQGANVTIAGSYVEHNTAARHGGGIQNQGTLTITNSSISENTASSFFGGGINNNTILSIAQTTLRSNQAAVAGGAIYNGGGTLALVNSTLETNNASQQGGAIYSQGNYTIADSTFRQNSTAGDGGGLFALNSNGTIQRTLFSGNHATTWGGGIGIWEGNATVSNSHLFENSAGDGGGLALNDRSDFNAGTTVKLYSTLVQSNTATSGGGGIFNYGGYFYLYDSWLAHNRAASGGGISSLYTVNAAGDIYLTSALYSYSTIFYNNRALSGRGGALYSTGYMEVENSFFQGNRAVQSGGAIAKDSSTNYPTSAGAVRYSTFVDNHAGAGGALYNAGTTNTAIASGNSLYMSNIPDTCAGTLFTSAGYTNGYNVTSDGSCLTAFTQSGDLHAQPLPNTAQAYRRELPNGIGVFEFAMLRPGSGNPAINAIPTIYCGLTLDLLGMPRPGGSGCDVGAIETDARIGLDQEQNINFAAPPNKILGDIPFSISATASSGLPVTFASTTPTICTVNGNTVTVQLVGICTLVASQAGDDTYRAALDVLQSFTISSSERENQIIEAAPILGPVVSVAPFTLNASTTSGLPVSFSSTTPTICTVNSNTVTPVKTGICSLLASQAGNTVYNPAPIVTLTFQIVLEAQPTIYTLYLPVINQ